MPDMADPYILPARLDVSAAQGLVTHLLSVPAQEPTILDASETQHLGALCAQALLAAGRRCTEEGGSLQILNASERIETQLDTMGLSIHSLTEGQA